MGRCLAYLDFLVVRRMMVELRKRRRVIRLLGIGGGLQLIFGICDMCTTRYLVISSYSFRGKGSVPIIAMKTPIMLTSVN